MSGPPPGAPSPTPAGRVRRAPCCWGACAVVLDGPRALEPWSSDGDRGAREREREMPAAPARSPPMACSCARPSHSCPGAPRACSRCSTTATLRRPCSVTSPSSPTSARPGLLPASSPRLAPRVAHPQRARGATPPAPRSPRSSCSRRRTARASSVSAQQRAAPSRSQRRPSERAAAAAAPSAPRRWSPRAPPRASARSSSCRAAAAQPGARRRRLPAAAACSSTDSWPPSAAARAAHAAADAVAAPCAAAAVPALCVLAPPGAGPPMAALQVAPEGVAPRRGGGGVVLRVSTSVLRPPSLAPSSAPSGLTCVCRGMSAAELAEALLSCRPPIERRQTQVAALPPSRSRRSRSRCVTTRPPR